MARPITQEERQILLESPELVMFTPQHAGLKPVVFLLVIPVTTMILLAAAILLWDPLLAWVESAPTLSCLTYVALCTLVPWICLFLKRKYDEAYGINRELRGLLNREDLTVEVVRIVSVVLQRAEVYAEGDDGPFVFGIAFVRNPFVPEEGSSLALLHAGKVCLAVRPDPRTRSFVRHDQGTASEGLQGKLTQKYADLGSDAIVHKADR